jgi:hypothetical protein
VSVVSLVSVLPLTPTRMRAHEDEGLDTHHMHHTHP